MKTNNINLDAFEKDRKSCKRSDKVLLVKNLKSEVTKSKLELLFSRYGDIKNLLLAPNNALAIVELKNSTFADNCFEKLQEYQLNGAPIYLEFAPVDMMASDDAGSEVEGDMDFEEIKPSKKEKKQKNLKEDEEPSKPQTKPTKAADAKQKEAEKSKVIKNLREDDDTKDN
jgi:RNA recognition motif-containing protein